MSIVIRRLEHRDVPAMLELQLECYVADLQEQGDIMHARIEVAPEYGWAAADERGVCAYLVTYPSVLGKVTPFGAEFQVRADADTLYLHDLAVGSRARGKGVGSTLVKTALESGRRAGMQHAALVAVQDSQPFWQSLGFSIEPEPTPERRELLASYIIPAVYMTRSLA